MAVAPASAARRASSGRMTPFTMNGPSHCPRSQPMSAHDGGGVCIHSPYAPKKDGGDSPRALMFGTVSSGSLPWRSQLST